MTWHMYLILGACVVAGVVALLAIFRKPKSGLTNDQANEIKQSYTVETKAHNAAEQQEQAELVANEKKAQTDLRALAEREQNVPEPWVGQSEEQIEKEANQALSQWNDEKLNMPLPVGIYIAIVMFWWLFYATVACCAPTTKPQLTTTQKLTKALNECSFSHKRLKINHTKKLADQQARCKRQRAQKDAKIKQLQSELLTLRKAPRRPWSNTALIVSVSVASTVAVVAIATTLVAIYIPETFGNKRGVMQ